MTPPTTTTHDSTQLHELRCLEVWGGSNATSHVASVPGLDIAVSARPVEGEQGGDLYLISSCSSGWISRVLLADVSGHGPVVSGLSSKLRKAMHKSINTVDQSKLARTLNGAFEEFSTEGRFATAVLMTYYAPSGHLLLVNAGHPPPLIRRAGSPAWKTLTKDTPGAMTQSSREVRVGLLNLPLGVIHETEYEQIAIKLNAGDRVCAYTDAYSETKNAGGRMLGVEGMCEMLSSDELIDSPIETLSERLEWTLEQQGFERADDDHTLLVIEHNGQERPKLSIPIVGNWIKNNFGLGHTDTVPRASSRD